MSMKSLIGAGFLFASSFAMAQKVSHPVITVSDAELTNGGFNPAYTAVRLKGTYTVAASNACEGSRYEFSFTRRGTLHFVPTLKQKQGRICPAFVDPNYTGVVEYDQVLRFERSYYEEKSFVDNVGAEGHNVSLLFLVNANAN